MTTRKKTATTEAGRRRSLSPADKEILARHSPETFHHFHDEIADEEKKSVHKHATAKDKASLAMPIAGLIIIVTAFVLVTHFWLGWF